MGRPRLTGFQYWHEAILLMLLAGLFLLARAIDPGFLRLDNQVELSRLVWEMALIALPMTFIIITAGIDLSVGATMSLAAVALGLSFEAGASPWVGAVVALLVGAAAGALNGVFTAYVKVHPLIVTLATLAAYFGIAEGISHARPISGFPAGFTAVGAGSLAGIPIPGIVFFVALGLAAVFLARTAMGQSLYAIGYNEMAARFSGIPVDRIKLLIYTLSGSAAGMAAIMFVARRNTAKANIGDGMELDVITAVVLGGTSIFGGRGRIIGTLLGILLIHETRQFVNWHWERDELNLIVVGTLLVVSVLLNALLSARQSKS